MDDLPLIPAMKIIDYLSIEDVLNLKLVNKWFYQFINENVRIKHLVVTTHGLSPNRRLFYTYDLINLQNLFKYDLDDNVYLNLNQPILGQLKQLCIYGTTITLETLNSLDRLVHLEVVYCKITNITENNVLSLSMLKILNLFWSKYRNNLIIDSTKLQSLKLYNEYIFSLVHPESVIYIEVNDYIYCKNFLPLCINLQHFYCYDLDLDLDDLNEFDLVKNLSKLKSIHFDAGDAFYSLVKGKKRFNKDLKIYLLNLEFEELPDDLPDGLYSSGKKLKKSLTKLFAKYYSRLADHCPSVKSAYYSDLERSFNQIPENFMKRFVNLTEFIVKKNINNLDQLIRVLGECKTITRLELHSSLGQHFFDFHLYNLCPNIDTLHIFGEEVLNFEFILKFKYIHQLIVNCEVESIEFAKRLVESREHITVEFNYFHNGDLFEITICKFRNGKYQFIIKKGHKELVLNSLDELYKLDLDTI